ncbi:MAG: hypothetical protein K2X77_01750 [Candidatus Obscuribacterales bacterium]|nr:hypothetical protein [Candidatus Obscuribacterales bacterium]
MNNKDPKALFGLASSEQKVWEYRELVARTFAENKMDRAWIQAGDFDHKKKLPECRFEFRVLRTGQIDRQYQFYASGHQKLDSQTQAHFERLLDLRFPSFSFDLNSLHFGVAFSAFFSNFELLDYESRSSIRSYQHEAARIIGSICQAHPEINEWLQKKARRKPIRLGIVVSREGKIVSTDSFGVTRGTALIDEELPKLLKEQVPLSPLSAEVAAPLSLFVVIGNPSLVQTESAFSYVDHNEN